MNCRMDLTYLHHYGCDAELQPPKEDVVELYTLVKRNVNTPIPYPGSDHRQLFNSSHVIMSNQFHPPPSTNLKDKVIVVTGVCYTNIHIYTIIIQHPNPHPGRHRHRRRPRAPPPRGRSARLLRRRPQRASPRPRARPTLRYSHGQISLLRRDFLRRQPRPVRRSIPGFRPSRPCDFECWVGRAGEFRES